MKGMKAYIRFFFQLYNQVLTGLFPLQASPILLPLSYQAAAPGDCGLACVAMILKTKGKSIENFEKFVEKYKSNSTYYNDPIGWTHSGLVSILEENGVDAQRFSWKTPHSILEQLQKSRYIIVSLRVPTIGNVDNKKVYEAINPKGNLINHLCVVRGIEKGNIILSDSRNVGIYQEKVAVSMTTFAKIFTGNCIVVS